MKYYSELSKLEKQIIRLEEMRSLFSVLANGAEESREEDVRSALWYIERSLSDIHQNLRSEFNDLWETISVNEAKELTEKIKFDYDWKSLDQITRTWATSSVK